VTGAYGELLLRFLVVNHVTVLLLDCHLPVDQVLGAAYPFIARRLLTQDSPELTATLVNLLYDKDGRFQFDRLESLLEQAAKAAVSSQPAVSAAATGTVAAASISSSSNARTRQQQVGSGSNSSSTGGLGLLADLVLGTQVSHQAQQVLRSLQPPGFTSSAVLNPAAGTISGRGSVAAAAGGPLALVLSPEGRYIRNILEDELAKGLDAAWRLSLDNAAEAASRQLQGAVDVAANLPTPIRAAVLPPWLQQEVQQQQQVVRGGSSSSSSHIGSTASSSNSSSNNDTAGDGTGSQSLLDLLLHIPKLAMQEDTEQVEGLRRLAVQLSAYSTAKQQQQQQQQLLSSSSSSSSSSSLVVQPRSSPGAAAPGGHDVITGGSAAVSSPPVSGVISALQLSASQQAATSAALEQLQQTANVLQWLTSEVQLLSPAARREAIAIPLNILSKLGSRLAARAVRAVLMPSPAAAAVAGSSGRGSDGQGRPAIPRSATVAAAAPFAVASGGQEVLLPSVVQSADLSTISRQKEERVRQQQVKQVPQRLLIQAEPVSNSDNSRVGIELVDGSSVSSSSSTTTTRGRVGSSSSSSTTIKMSRGWSATSGDVSSGFAAPGFSRGPVRPGSSRSWADDGDTMVQVTSLPVEQQQPVGGLSSSSSSSSDSHNSQQQQQSVSSSISGGDNHARNKPHLLDHNPSLAAPPAPLPVHGNNGNNNSSGSSVGLQPAETDADLAMVIEADAVLEPDWVVAADEPAARIAAGVPRRL
jgi:hypothetical protein